MRRDILKQNKAKRFQRFRLTALNPTKSRAQRTRAHARATTQRPERGDRGPPGPPGASSHHFLGVLLLLLPAALLELPRLVIRRLDRLGAFAGYLP